jgi:putative flippase GtrA
MTDLTPPPPAPLSLWRRLRSSGRILIKEVAAFGLVGVIGLVFDVGLFTVLTHDDHVGALKSKAISTLVATVITYVGNRYLSFSHRARSSIARETTFFFGINVIVLILSELIIALFIYPLHYGHTSTTVSAVNVGTIGLGTIFRFWAYKRFVFLHPDKVHDPVDSFDLDAELAE